MNDNDVIEDKVTEVPVKKKMKMWKKILIIMGSILGGMALVFGIIVWIFLGRINYETDADNQIKSELENSSSEGASILDADKVEDKESIKNFLLVGVENIGYGEESDQGNTDCMIVLSVNTDKGTVKMISFMRDIYATMPGVNKATKLNNVYNNGGGKLLTSTLEKTFGITIDGRAVVKFSDFEKIIDLLGGVTIELSSQEASYLNSTNYISNPSNRHLYAGKNHLNGNQALGYSRVRKVPTVSGKSNNEGRNERQRKVLMAIYKKYKEKSMISLTKLVYDILPLIYKTNIESSDAIDLVSAVKDMNISKIQSINVPKEGTYHSQHAVTGINPNLMNDFIIIDDMKTNRDRIKKFMTGEDTKTMASASPNVSATPKATIK